MKRTHKTLAVLLSACMLAALLPLTATDAHAEPAADYYNREYLEECAEAAYDVPGLGCTYTASASTFKVWAPEADAVQLRLYAAGTDDEPGSVFIGAESMTCDTETGIWSLTLSGDCKNIYYTYAIDRGGDIRETQDPYAVAVGANGDRSMVCDLDATDPVGWDEDQHVFFDSPGEAVVWEVHVRDFSIDVSSGVSEADRGKYLAFTEGGTTVGGEGAVSTCVDYLVAHNVNCVLLMPIQDFASVDETGDGTGRSWGYDTKNYSVPEGSYSSDPYNGSTRIKEFKMLVQALHDRGIAVVMDVVYNHTCDLADSALERTAPGYYYRMSSADDFLDGSGSGNVLASEKKMCSRFISDSLLYWVNEYHIDGFSFDLMGCFDVASVQSWRDALDGIDTRILTFGEPWAGGEDVGISDPVNQSSLKRLTRVGGFNKGYSDALKGANSSAASSGFLTGGAATEIMKAAGGSATDFSGASVSQLVNFTDSHDNWTLFDKLLAANGGTGFTAGSDDDALYNNNKEYVDAPSSKLLGQMKTALTSAVTSQGIPFTLAGTEFCRTKYGDGNSWRTPDRINAIDWTRAKSYSAAANYYAGLVAIRKALGAFSDNTQNSISTVSGCTAWQIVNSKSGQWNKVIVALNNTASSRSISLAGSWVVVANGTVAGVSMLGNASGSYTVPPWSSVVLVDASSYGNYSQPHPGTTTVVTEHYTRDSETGSYSLALTENAIYKEGQTWRASQNPAILSDYDLDAAESTASDNAACGGATAGGAITVKYYYTLKKELSVTVSDGIAHGSVTPNRATAREGDTVALTVVPEAGYELETQTVQQGETAAAVTNRWFTMPAGDVTVTAQFAPADYVITYDSNGGTGIPDKLYTIESTDALPTPVYAGHDFAGWKVTAADGSWTANEVLAAGAALTGRYGDVTLTAQWTLTDYTVTVNTVTVTTGFEHGKVTADKTENVHIGDTVNLTVEPEDGYTLAYLFVTKDGTSPAERVEVTENRFTMPDGDVTVTAEFTFSDGIGAHLAGYTISLKGDIGVNFYMELAPEIAESETAYMHFTIPNGSKTIEQDIPVSEATVKGNYYVFKCSAAAKDMTAVITAQIIEGEASGTEYTYSVKEYADYLLENADENGTELQKAYAKAVPLVKAMLNYGARAQLYFGQNTDSLANADLDEGEQALGDVTISADAYTAELPEGVTFAGATLSLKSETTLSLYFRSSDELAFSCTGYTVEKAAVGKYQVARIRGIKAQDIGNNFTLTINGTGTVTYSPLNYCQNVLNDGAQSESLQDVAKALYLYWQAAKTYFA